MVDIEPIFVDVNISLDDFRNGKTCTIKYHRDEECTSCNASQKQHTCYNCGGSGMEHKIMDTIMGRVAASVPCSSCKGTGVSKPNASTNASCNSCSDTGYVKKEITRQVDIPNGVISDINISISNAGNYNNVAKTYGDVVLRFNEDFWY